MNKHFWQGFRQGLILFLPVPLFLLLSSFFLSNSQALLATGVFASFLLLYLFRLLFHEKIF